MFDTDIKTIKTINGVDFSKISPVENVIKKKNEIHLISVAHLYSCHGYDRVIKGLSKYDNTLSEVKVFFDIVGDGQEYEPLKDLIKQCGAIQRNNTKVRNKYIGIGTYF